MAWTAFDLRENLPAGHPAASASGPPLGVYFAGVEFFYEGEAERDGDGALVNVSARDMRTTGVDAVASAALPVIFEPVSQGGLTVRDAGLVETVRGSRGAGVRIGTGAPTLRLLYGGDGSGDSTLAYNEVYELDLDNPGAGWQPLGKFTDDPTAGFGEPVFGTRVLTGLASFAGEDYAIDTEGDLFRLAYAGMDASFDRRELALSTGWDRGGALASAGERGSMFLVGWYGSRQGLGADASLADTVVWELDPRTTFLADAWWGASGDFERTAATSWGTFGDGLGAPDRLEELYGAAYDDGALVISGSFAFGGEGAGRSFADGAIALNVDATGAADDPFLMRLDSWDAGRVLGMAGRGGGGRTAPPVDLDIPDDGFDGSELDGAWASLSYSKKALRSGVLTEIFAERFAAGRSESSEAAELCRAWLIESGAAEDALRRYAGKRDAIGRAAAHLEQQMNETGGSCGDAEP